MRPYGMNRLDFYDTDVTGCAGNGRATGVYSRPTRGGDTRAYHSLRGGKKATVRRHAKRAARAAARAHIRDELS